MWNAPTFRSSPEPLPHASPTAADSKTSAARTFAPITSPRPDGHGRNGESPPRSRPPNRRWPRREPKEYQSLARSSESGGLGGSCRVGRLLLGSRSTKFLPAERVRCHPANFRHPIAGETVLFGLGGEQSATVEKRPDLRFLQGRSGRFADTPFWKVDCGRVVP